MAIRNRQSWRPTTEATMHRVSTFSVTILVALFCATPSALANTIVDLTAGGSGSSNGAFYEWTDFSATGTGVINAFLRVQNNGSEQGYNHSLGHNVPWDTKPGLHTHDIQFQDLVVAMLNDQAFYQFLLDVNESNGQDNEFLQLLNVQIFTRDSAISSADESLDHLGTLRFNNDVGVDGDTTVNLNYNLNPGRGAGDMFLYVPVSLFAGTMPTDFVYFFSQLDNTDAGFEEWAMLQSDVGGGGNGGPENPAPIPEPGSMMLLGTGLLFAARKLRQRAS
jgi:hypothetical protein